MNKLWLIVALASCTPASAHIPVGVSASCSGWPRETRLTLPTTTEQALDWHDRNWQRARAAHDSCRDALRKLVRDVNSGKAGV